MSPVEKLHFAPNFDTSADLVSASDILQCLFNGLLDRRVVILADRDAVVDPFVDEVGDLNASGGVVHVVDDGSIGTFDGRFDPDDGTHDTDVVVVVATRCW